MTAFPNIDQLVDAFAPVVEEFLREEMTHLILVRSAAETWPEVFGRMSKAAIDRLTVEQSDAMIQHHVLWSDGIGMNRANTGLARHARRSRQEILSRATAGVV